MDKKRVYIAGALSAHTAEYLFNVHKMMMVAEEAIRQGYSAFIPCTDLLMGIKFGYSTVKEYFDNSLPWVKASEAVLLVPGWLKSQGTIKEIEVAMENDVPVFDSIEGMNQYFESGDEGLALSELILNEEGTVVDIIYKG